MCVSVLPACMCLHRVCAWSPQRSEAVVERSETGVTGSCEPPGYLGCGCWEENSGSLQDRQAPSTSESTLQNQCEDFKQKIVRKCMLMQVNIFTILENKLKWDFMYPFYVPIWKMYWKILESSLWNRTK